MSILSYSDVPKGRAFRYSPSVFCYATAAVVASCLRLLAGVTSRKSRSGAAASIAHGWVNACVKGYK